MVQTLHHLLPSGNNYSQKLLAVDDGKEIQTYHILKHWQTCWLVEVFEVLSVSFQYFVSKFSSIFHYNKPIKKWIIKFFYLRCFVVVSFILFGVPDHGAVPNHGPVQGAVCTKQMMVLYHTWCFWTKSWCWTSSICGTSLWISSLSLRPSKNQKKVSKNIYQKISRNLQKPKKN